MSLRRAGSLTALLGAAAVLLTSCTTIPRLSAPSVIRSVGIQGEQQQPNITPTAGADASEIVQGFLSANAGNDLNHASARTFLSPQERNQWSDSTIRVIDRATVGNLEHGKVLVTGNLIGSIDATGAYDASLLGDGTGTGGVPLSLPFGMTRVKGQWRINSAQAGLVITAAQFQLYQPRIIYFFDASETHLVPDPRYTQLVDPRDLVTWLVAQLAQGPRNGLATSLPNQTDPKRVRVVAFPSNNNDRDGPIIIEIPGASQLGAGNLNRLAAQLSTTLDQIEGLGEVEITDGGVPVRIPAVGGTTFFAAQLANQFDPQPPASRLFYVDDGAVYQSSGRRLPGKVGTGAYDLSSVALTDQTGSLQIAGVRGAPKHQTLDMGTPSQLTATKLRGQLSRPAWAPDQDEVWIGAGTTLYRVSASGATRVVPVDGPGGKATGTVTAVRLSPEGARVALVLTSGGTSQIYVGSVVRSSTGVRVAGLAPISPQGISVTDVAWNDQLKLFAIGTDLRAGGFGVYEVQSDGSLWTLKPSGLPGPPDSVTVAVGRVAVVSTGGTVERQDASSWDGLAGAETRGTNPIYLE